MDKVYCKHCKYMKIVDEKWTEFYECILDTHEEVDYVIEEVFTVKGSCYERNENGDCKDFEVKG